MGQLGGRSPEGGGTVMTRGQSPARRRSSGGEKPVRRTPGRWERMHDARAWTDETNGARGQKIFRPTGGGSVLTGSDGEGGPEGWTLRGGGVGEREGEGGGPWCGVEREREGGALPCDSGERWGRCDAGRRG
jgi:hypothetical protein